MAEYKRNRDNDYRYHNSKREYSANYNVAASIIEMRTIYSDMEEYTFATWYSRRYGIPTDQVLKTLEKAAKQ